MKIYVAAVEALRTNERQDETHVTTSQGVEILLESKNHPIESKF